MLSAVLLFTLHCCFSGEELDVTSAKLIKHALKDSTRATYNCSQRKFLQFCYDYGFEALPVEEDTLIGFVSHLHNRGLKGSSIQVYLAAVKSLHTHTGLPYPENMSRLTLALRGAKVLSLPPVRKLPITFSVLCKLMNNLSYRQDKELIQCAMAVAFFGCLRAGELCISDKEVFDSTKHLCVKDVKFFNEDKMFSLFLKQSKTDRLSNGVEIFIGCSAHDICAYCMLKQFLCSRSDMDPSAPLFADCHVSVLRKSYFVNATRLALSAMGLNPSLYSGHSFRAGSATSGAQCGFNHWELKMLGRWSSECFHIYLRDPKIVANFAQRLASSLV